MEFNEFVSNQKSSKLNNLLISNLPIICTSDIRLINENKMFIMTIISNSKLIFKFDYYIAGTFDKNKNMWIWASKSSTLDKSLTTQSEKLRNDMNIDIEHDDSIKPITLDKLYVIILTDVFQKWLGRVADYLHEINHHLITISRSDRYIDVFVVKRIVYTSFDI
jgi:hypothetical protein